MNENLTSGVSQDVANSAQWVYLAPAVVAIILIVLIWKAFAEERVDFEVRRFYFANGIFGAMTFLIALGLAIHVNSSQSQVLEEIMKFASPILTLVIGFYFSTPQQESTGANQPMAPEDNQSKAVAGKSKGDPGGKPEDDAADESEGDPANLDDADKQKSNSLQQTQSSAG